MNEKPMSGTLASLSENQAYPRMMKPEEAKYTPVKAGNGQNGERGFAEGTNMLPKRTPAQDAPRYAQDDGPGKSGAGTPSKWGVTNGFAPSKSDAEQGTSVSVQYTTVDLKTGLAAYCNPLPK